VITCDCSVHDYDSAQLYIDKIVKARKEHKCCECREPIKKGEKYESVKMLYEGDWSAYKTCISCLRIRRDYCPNGWMFEFLEETIHECLGFWYTEDPNDWDDDDDDDDDDE
jgi:hypothetical protein